MGFHNQKNGDSNPSLLRRHEKHGWKLSLNSTSNRHDLYGNIVYDFQGFSIPTFDYLRVYGVILPIGSMVLLYMVTFTINIPPMLAYIPYMDPMGYVILPGCKPLSLLMELPINQPEGVPKKVTWVKIWVGMQSPNTKLWIILRRWDYVLETKPASIMGLYHLWMAMDGEWRS